VRAIGPQLAPIRAVSEAWPDPEVNAADELRGTLLLDVGARFEHLAGGLSVDGRIYNLLGTRYTQGGSTLFPYPQEGRWFLVNLEYAFDPKKGESRGRD